MQGRREGREAGGRQEASSVYARMGRENKMHWDNWQPRRVSESRKNGEEKIEKRERGERESLDFGIANCKP